MEEKKMTIADVSDAYDRFMEGSTRAEQHTFFKVMLTHTHLNKWLNELRKEWNEESAQKFIKFVDDAIKYFGW